MLAINEVNFPDTEFRRYISKNFDVWNKGYLFDEEIAKVMKIDISYHKDMKSVRKIVKSICTLSNKKITSLKGIEHFHNLTYLDCSGLDIKDIDVTYNPKLIYFNCSDTKISSLDVSHNPWLESFYCSCTGLDKINICKNINLKYLDCSHTNIEDIDVTHNLNLEMLRCMYTKLSFLDLTHNRNNEGGDIEWKIYENSYYGS